MNHANIQFRTVTLDDIPILHQRCWPHRTYAATEELVQRILKQMQQNRGQGFVLLEETAIIGYGQITYWRKKAEIADLYIIESHRKRGLGTALIQYLIQLTKSKNLFVIEIGVEEPNKLALKLYKRLGFKEYQTIPGVPPIIYLSLNLQ